MAQNKFHIIGCHAHPDRSFKWKGEPFPICSRCTGIHLGYISMPLFLLNWWTIDLIWTIVMILPTYLDGASQMIFKRESKNWIRFSTGLLAGVGLMSLATILGKIIVSLIKS